MTAELREHTEVGDEAGAGDNAGPADKAEQIALEQTYVDEAMRCYVDARQKRSAASASASGTAADVRALRDALADDTVLGPDDPVAFGWVDTEDGKRLYVGKSRVLDDERNLLVLSWKTPAAKRYYSARPEEPGDVTKKRTFRTSRNIIDDFTDLIFAELVEEIAALERSEIRLEDGLLDSLSAGRSDRMADIARTIQAAQYEIIAHEPESLLVIQGGPGTGKTAVALHRASWLLHTVENLTAENVLIVTPTPTLLSYVKGVLPALGDQDVRHAALADLVGDLVHPRRDEPAEVARIKGDSRMRHVLAEGLRRRVRGASSALSVRRRSSRSSVEVPAATVDGLLRPLSYLGYGEGRAKFIEALRVECVRLLGMRGAVAFDAEFDAVSFSQQVDRVWPAISPQQFLRDLLGSRARLQEAGEKHLTAAELDLLHRPAARYIADEPWTPADAFLMHEVRALMNPAGQRRYDHIVVDEAQDLSGMQLCALERRSTTGMMTLVGDIAQSTGPYRRDSWDSVLRALGRSGVPADRRTLRHVYRVPQEIFAVADALQEEIAPQLDSPESVRSTGREPRVVDAPHLPAAVVECAREHLGDGLMVGIVAPGERLPEIAAELDRRSVRYGTADDGRLSSSVNLIRPENAKGLEFDAVVVADPDAVYRMDAGARLLYIALTRTTNRLDLVLADGRVPEVLAGVLEDAQWQVVEGGAEIEVDAEVDADPFVEASADFMIGVLLDNVAAARALPVVERMLERLRERKG